MAKDNTQTENTATNSKVDVGSILQGVGGIGGAAATAYSTYAGVQGADNWINRANASKLNSSIGTNSFDDWTQAYLNNRPMDSIGLKDVGFDRGRGAMNVASASMQGAAAGAAFGGWGALVGGVAGLAGGLFGYEAARKKAERSVRYGNNAITQANVYNNELLNNNLMNLKSQQYNDIAASYIAAKGGPLATQGSDWSTGLNYIGAGGSHEQNPNGGIQQGIAPDGLPNLVEEGEVIWNGDYVFSKRLKVPKAVRNKYKLRGTKPMSFADAALEFNKEMEERPNDPISKRGRDGMLAKLADVQEEKRAKIAAKEQAQQAAMMGMMGMPQDQMAIQEPIVPEEQPVDEMGQGMPMVEGYAAKGGPIGHKFALGTPPYDPYFNFNWNDYWSEGLNPEELERSAQQAYKQQYGLPDFKLYSTETKPILTLKKGGLGEEYYDWLKSLSNDRYIDLLNKIYPNKGDKYNEFLKNKDNRALLFNWANTGNPGDAYNGIFNAAPHLSDSRYLNGEKPTPANTDWYKDLPVVVGDRNVPSNVVIPSQARNKDTDTPTSYNIDHPHPARQKSGTQSDYPWQGYLRYAPAIGAGLGVFSDLMGWTNKPDYSAADAILNASRGVRDVSFNPIGDYARYRPVDTRFALNALNGAAGATRRGIINTSAGNRGTAMAGILAADNNYMNSIGNTLFTAENANYDRYMKALAHNAEINKFNSEGFLKAAMANQGSGEVRAKYAAMAADARQRALALASANRSANLTNLFDSLGNIGIDALNRADARWLAQFWPGSQGQESLKRKHGGRIRKRRRGRVI